MRANLSNLKTSVHMLKDMEQPKAVTLKTRQKGWKDKRESFSRLHCDLPRRPLAIPIKGGLHTLRCLVDNQHDD